MPVSRHRRSRPMMTRATRLPLTGVPSARPLDLSRAGMPSLGSVHTVIPFKPRASRPEYAIVRTTEVDSYEPSALGVRRVLAGKATPLRSALATALKPAPRAGDDFAGTDRKAAKLSTPDAQREGFQDLRALIDSLE